MPKPEKQHKRPKNGRHSGWVLGINHGAHDASAALLKHGQIVVWVEQERISRVKHAIDQSPAQAAATCLDFAGIALADVDAVALGSDHGLLSQWLGLSADERRSTLFYDSMDYLFPSELFGGPIDVQVEVVRHHVAHAASAFFPSGFDSAVTAVMDAMGEAESTTLALRTRVTDHAFRTFPVGESLGFFFEAACEYCGFTKQEAGKLMGLASYGDPRMEMPIHPSLAPGGLLSLRDGPFSNGRREIDRMKQSLVAYFSDHCFPFVAGLREEIMAYADFAASVQRAVERVIVEWIKESVEKFQVKQVALSGGVALNCTSNGVISQLACVEDLFVQPASNDAGVALGAALEVSSRLYLDDFNPTVMRHAYWGLPVPEEKECERLVREMGLPYEILDNETLCRVVAGLIRNGFTIAWHQGREEVGPRSLGARSIFGDPRTRRSLVRINSLKGREVWRPLAPAVLSSCFSDFFDGTPNPFMVVASQVKPEARRLIPAVVHVDGSARPQAVDVNASPLFADLLAAFGRTAGVPVLINTSLNRRGEPICSSAFDSLKLFRESDVDALALGNILLQKRRRQE